MLTDRCTPGATSSARNVAWAGARGHSGTHATACQAVSVRKPIPLLLDRHGPHPHAHHRVLTGPPTKVQVEAISVRGTGGADAAAQRLSCDAQGFLTQLEARGRR